MDEIQDCIADAQFGEVLRGRESSRPTAKIPMPPDTFDPEAFAKRRRVDLRFAVAQPTGVYLLTKFHPRGETVFKFLAEFSVFSKLENPDLEAYTNLLDLAVMLPIEYKNTVDGISVNLNSQILPQLRSAPSMNRMISQGSRPANEKRDSYGIDVVADEDIDYDEDEDDCGEDKPKGELERLRSLVRFRTENKILAQDAFGNLQTAILKDLSRTWDDFKSSPNYNRFISVLWYSEKSVQFNHFNVFRDLGRGAFGVVSGAKLRTTGSLHALKCMSKKLVKGKKALKLVKAEREVLAKLGEVPSQFTVYLQYAFTDKDTFYLALPLCSGGDLQYHLAIARSFSPERTMFHVAEVVLGLAHLHGLGILYRDLKPDNILLDEEGHCRISDMGLAVVTNGKSLRGRAGTPGYWPPEMIQKQRYTYSADWWSLGCVLYELLTGRCPFSKLNSKMERDDATLKWDISFPKYVGEHIAFPEQAKSLILKLLNRDKNGRLGSGERGAEDVKDDPYFSSVNWSALSQGEIEPVWKPRKEIIHAFNQSDIDGKSNEHDYRKLKLSAEDEIPDFEYTSVIKHQEEIVRVLELEDAGKLGHLEPNESPSCCVIV